MTGKLSELADEIAQWKMIAGLSGTVAECATICAEVLNGAEWDEHAQTFRISKVAVRARERAVGALGTLSELTSPL